jgi:hypothetical protein
MRQWLLVLAACTHPPPAAPLASKAGKSVAPDGFASCDVALLDSRGVLSTWKLAGGRAEQLGKVEIGKPIDLSCGDCPPFARPMKAEWADREHLFVSPDREHVFMITGDGIEQLPVPDVSKVAAPKPDGAQETGLLGNTYTQIDLVVKDGEAWWSRCPWSWPNDGGACAGWVNVRVWPSSKTLREDQSIDTSHAWREQAPPSYNIDGDACIAPDGTRSTIVHPTGESWEYEELYGAKWLSASPPRLLVLWGPHSEFDSPPANRWQLRDGCANVIAEGSTPRPAAADTWLSSEHDAIVIHRGASELGRVPADRWSAVAVRPAR